MKYGPSFGNSENKPKQSSVEQFITAVNQQVEKETKGNFIKRNFGSLTAVIPLLGAYIYDMAELGSLVGLRKKLPAEQFKKAIFKSSGKISLATALGAVLCFGINKLLNSRTDKNYENIKKKFNEINIDSDAKLADKMLVSNYASAAYNGISGKITLNRNFVNDPLMGLNSEKLLKHELVHARQYETVARSKDGIKKINFAMMKLLSKSLENNPEGKQGIKEIYNDIKADSEKYKDTKITIMCGGAEVNMKDYIEAMNTLLNNPNAGMNDIPIVIDKQHYQKVIDKKGALSAEEEKKADEYYKAMLDYKPVSFNAAMNPWSSYRQNILEKEAYKENPSVMTWLSDLFNK